MKKKRNGIQLTELDAVRIERSIMEQQTRSPEGSHDATELEAILDAAAIVPAKAVAPDVVTMNSIVVLEEPQSAHRMTVTLVYPKDSDPEQSRISVLSPVGRALLGARVGDVIRATVPDNPPREFTVKEVQYQPEAAGHFDV